MTKYKFSSHVLRSKPAIRILGYAAVLIIGAADYFSGTELNLSIFYLLPIACVTWFVGRDDGATISVIATTVSFVSDVIFSHQQYSHAAIPYWNTAMRGCVSLILVALLSRLKAAHLREMEASRIKGDMLALLDHLNVALSADLELQSVGENIVETIGIFYPGYATTVRLLSRESGELNLLASGNLDEQPGKSKAGAWRVTPELLGMKVPIIVRNAHTDAQGWDREFCRCHGLLSYLGLPLVAGGEFLGIISLYTKVEHEFTREETSFFVTLAGQAAIALQNAQLFKEVRSGHAQLRDLSRRLFDVQEFDRRHIATELHDEIGQALTGLNLTLEMVGRLPFEEARPRLEKAQALVNELIGRVRGLSLDLRPSMLDDLGLLPTLLWHLERYTASTQVEVELNHRELEGKRFGSRIETAAYRIIQEALTNVARHARVRRASVHVWCAGEMLIIEVQDDGTGFDPESALRSGHSSGLTGMRERTTLLGGVFNIDSTPGSGTCVIAELPAQSGARQTSTVHEASNDRIG